jgi:tetratricopeptide (TPR) repeat protein
MRVMQKVPAIVHVLRRNLATALWRGELAEAEALLERLRDEDPASRETGALALELLVRAERVDEARRVAAQLLERFPDSARILHWAGRAAYEQRDWVTAERCFAESGRVAPHWRSDWHRGRALTQLGRFDEAEALLAPLAATQPECARDAAWLYERKDEPERALRYIELHLEHRPDDRAAQAQRLRLRARALTPQEVIDEVAALRELGEPVPEEVVATWVEALLVSGRGAEVRAWVGEHAARLAPHAARRAAWVAHRLQAWDVAFDLFLLVLDDQTRNVKFLGAIEKAARQCGRVADLAAAYDARGPRVRELYGRARRLRGARGKS